MEKRKDFISFLKEKGFVLNWDLKYSKMFSYENSNGAVIDVTFSKYKPESIRYLYPSYTKRGDEITITFLSEKRHIYDYVFPLEDFFDIINYLMLGKNGAEMSLDMLTWTAKNLETIRTVYEPVLNKYKWELTHSQDCLDMFIYNIPKTIKYTLAEELPIMFQTLPFSGKLKIILSLEIEESKGEILEINPDEPNKLKILEDAIHKCMITNKEQFIWYNNPDPKYTQWTFKYIKELIVDCCNYGRFKQKLDWNKVPDSLVKIVKMREEVLIEDLIHDLEIHILDKKNNLNIINYKLNSIPDFDKYKEKIKETVINALIKLDKDSRIGDIVKFMDRNNFSFWGMYIFDSDVTSVYNLLKESTNTCDCNIFDLQESETNYYLQLTAHGQPEVIIFRAIIPKIRKILTEKAVRSYLNRPDKRKITVLNMKDSLLKYNNGSTKMPLIKCIKKIPIESLNVKLENWGVE